jgi:hypothetical protein
MQRYPENISLNIDDFRHSGWRNAVNSSNQESYCGMYSSFISTAQAAIENGKMSEGKVLWLLADACSMMLTPGSPNEPFKPFMVWMGKRSALPEDFQALDLALFSRFSEEVDNFRLQARLADLVWLLSKPRNLKHALLAIDAYRRIPLDAETWVSDGRECWERAIVLSKMLKAGAGERLKEMEINVIESFSIAKISDGLLPLWLSNLLAENSLGRNKSQDIAEKLEGIGRDFDSTDDLHHARAFFGATSKWYKQLGSRAKVAEMTVHVAESWVKEAVARESSESPSYMAAASCYENAIQTYRLITRKERAVYRIDERISELRIKLTEAGCRSLEEMNIVASSPLDIKELVEGARTAVKDKTNIEALESFVNICSNPQVKEIRKNSEKILNENPLHALISASHMSRDGRVIAKRPGLEFETNSVKNEAVIWAEMVRFYGIEIEIAVRSAILPALEIMVLEHRLRENDFVALVSCSPIVPKGRERLFGKALFAGYEMDFVVALHLLVPQIEQLVRCHLKNAGAKTTNLDEDGIENENGLSALMGMPEALQIFDEDLVFEVKALFCDAHGANLRNELAHGLLDYEECRSAYSIYAWWFGLKLVFKPFWITRQSKS